MSLLALPRQRCDEGIYMSMSTCMLTSVLPFRRRASAHRNVRHGSHLAVHAGSSSMKGLPHSSAPAREVRLQRYEPHESPLCAGVKDEHAYIKNYFESYCCSSSHAKSRDL